MNKTGTTSKELADALMLSALQRAHDAKLKRGEAQDLLAIMQAYKAWSGASQRSELVERSKEIAAIGHELAARRMELPDDLLERTKAAVRTAVGSAVRDTMTEEFAKANGRARRPSKTK